jgi:hypothetical protein
MTQYEITLLIESDTRQKVLRDTLDRIVKHTFGSSGQIDNFVEIDDDADYELDDRCCHCQATDDHNEGTARAAGAIAYTRTDGHTITFASHRPDLEED